MKNGKGGFGKPITDLFKVEFGPDFTVVSDDGGGRPVGAGGGGSRPDTGNGGGGGKPSNAGTMKGDLYGDQIVVLRDLDPADGDGDGEPLLDANEQLVAVGYDPDGLIRPFDADGYFPVYFELVAGEEEDYEIPAQYLPYVQEVELERANVARAPDQVMQQALEAAIGKLTTADVVTADPAGRLMYSFDDGETFLTIDAPLENLAVYQALMTAGSENTWTSATASWDSVMVDGAPVDLSFLMDLDGWAPSALIGAAWSKEGEITLDALIYENTALGLNEVSASGEALTIEYYSFTVDGVETFDYDRADLYADTWLRWIEVEDGAPVFKYGTVFDAVFDGEQWAEAEDLYMAIDDMNDDDPFNDDFILVSAENAGVNDFAQAADDSRAVIEFMHTFMAEEIGVEDVPVDYMALAIA
jgi:hypothetical protein